MPDLLPVVRATVIPEKNDMKTEKNVEKDGKAKAKEPVTSAGEEEERIKAK